MMDIHIPMWVIWVVGICVGAPLLYYLVLIFVSGLIFMYAVHKGAFDGYRW